MTRFKLTACAIASALSLHGCSQILEPVSFLGGAGEAVSAQEEFVINIESLNFKSAKKANNAPYPRKLMLTGVGSKANVFNEADFLNSNIPEPSESLDYLLGVGDELSFVQLKEFRNKFVKLPVLSPKAEYLIGVGDKLRLILLKESMDDPNVSFDELGEMSAEYKTNDSFLISTAFVGTNGNLLLLGVGSVKATDRTLDNVRAEVRNILIRNGLSPNFLLSIEKFNSKKAYVTTSGNKESVIGWGNEVKVIPINNLPISLKEVALNTGLSESSTNFVLIKLTRNAKVFRITAEQLFDFAAQEVIIEDKDQIEIEIVSKESTNTKSVVGSKGNMLLEGVGSISALNRTLNDVHEEVSSILIKKGLKPNFQLELVKSASKKAYLIQKNAGSIIVPLTNSKISLRELILSSKSSVISTVGLHIITLKRNGQAFRMTGNQLLDSKTPDIWVQNEDQIELEILAYKQGQVFALGGAGSATIVPIDPSKRETLADILFVPDGALKNLLAKRSEVYLLRGRNSSIAYHLDAQNVSRILVAAQTELRPNDIVYVADRPIISFSRTLAEINPLRILLRDLNNGDIP